MQDSPDGGALRVGETVAPLYVDQSRESLDPEKTVFEEITGGQEEIVLGKSSYLLLWSTYVLTCTILGFYTLGSCWNPPKDNYTVLVN